VWANGVDVLVFDAALGEKVIRAVLSSVAELDGSVVLGLVVLERLSA